LVQVNIEQDERHITGVYVGGQCYLMGEGCITLVVGIDELMGGGLDMP
jgi:hypothetical protein